METKQALSTEEKRGIELSLRNLFYLLAGVPIIGTVMVAICVLNLVPDPHKNEQFQAYLFFSHLGYGLLIGGAAYAAGGGLGFLFGLPRYMTNPDSPKEDYSRNDNLIQISDWLTKIIVGLGLTNLYKIPRLLQHFGTNASVLFSNTTTGAAVAECILIYFLICGFLLGYLWTNIKYIPILKFMDKLTVNIGKMQKQETALNDLLARDKDYVNLNDPDALNKIVQKQQGFAGTKKILSQADLSAMADKARSKMESGISEQSSIPDSKKDPNKGKWGGKSENNNRKITADVSEIDDSDLYTVKLTVESTGSAPINDGDVLLFSLHNSFREPYRMVTAKNGKALLEFVSYGAFTVGVLCDDGTTELEYDLVNAKAPKGFISN